MTTPTLKQIWQTVFAATIVTGFATPLCAQQATGPARVKYPAGFETNFVLYSIVDRFDGKHARFMYIDKPSLAASKPGEALPDGVIVVMQLRAVELDSAGEPVLDEKGRMKPTDKVNAVFVQEKRKGWGQDIAPELRNGDWDYAVFKADGSVNDQIKLDGCFTCHLNRKGRDFTFSTWKTIADGFKP